MYFTCNCTAPAQPRNHMQPQPAPRLVLLSPCTVSTPLPCCQAAPCTQVGTTMTTASTLLQLRKNNAPALASAS